MRSHVRAFGAFLTLFTLACVPSGGDPDGGISHCVPGQSVACACSDGRTGAQECDDDGLYPPCTCTGESAARCVPGESAACTCTDGESGAQICGTDYRFTPCECTAAPDAGVQDAGPDAGTVDAGADAGVPDGGPDDGGTPDAGPPDAGPTTPEWPAAAADYVFGPSAYTTSLSLPPPDTQGAATCCRDFGTISANGEGALDNAWASFAANLKDAGADVNALLTGSIQSGSLVLLWDGPLLDPGSASPFALVKFAGAFEGSTDFAAASGGSGTFVVPASDFVDGTGEPAEWFWPAEITGGTLAVDTPTLQLALPLPGGLLPIPLHDVQIRADASVTAAPAVTLSNGTISGYTHVDEVFGGYDYYVASACGCLGLSGALFTKGATGWTGACVADAATRCTQPTEGFCVLLGAPQAGGGFCDTLPALATQQIADLDLDPATPGLEGWSFGMRFEAVPAEIVGLAP